jgi:hypothetical protein
MLLRGRTNEYERQDTGYFRHSDSTMRTFGWRQWHTDFHDGFELISGSGFRTIGMRREERQ